MLGIVEDGGAEGMDDARDDMSGWAAAQSLRSGWLMDDGWWKKEERGKEGSKEGRKERKKEMGRR